MAISNQARSNRSSEGGNSEYQHGYEDNGDRTAPIRRIAEQMREGNQAQRLDRPTEVNTSRQQSRQLEKAIKMNTTKIAANELVNVVKEYQNERKSMVDFDKMMRVINTRIYSEQVRCEFLKLRL